VPVTVGVASLVMSSVLDAPESDAAVRFGALGAPGGKVSNVTVRRGELPLALPATSVWVA